MSSNHATRLLTRAGRSPALLLLAVGGFLGLTFPLGKLSTTAGVSPIVWAAVISTGSAVTLGCALLLRGRPVRLDAQHLRYFAVTALVSYTLPNVLVFGLIPRAGSGFTAILFTLSPMLTVALSLVARLRPTAPLELGGILVGFVGAVLVASARGEAGKAVEWAWIALGFLIPLSLAVGNVYRTLDWPKDADGLWLAVGSNAVSAGLLAIIALPTGAVATAAQLLTIPGVVAAQIAGSACMFALFFRLQDVGGPVTLSQIGTVGAAVGVMVGTLVLGERYAAIVWAGVAIIAVGLALTIRARLER